MKQIYAAGPMDFASPEQQYGWRNELKGMLAGFAKVLDPTRRPHESDLTSKEVFDLDMLDINNSDIMIVDGRALNIPTFGTPSEVFYGSYIRRIPVIAWYDSDNAPDLNRKRVFQEALYTREFDSLESAVDHIKAYYL